MHFLVFFCPLVEPFIIFFRQLICRVVMIILLVSHFSGLHSRSFRSRSFLFQKFEDKPCGDNTAYGAAYYTPKNFVRGHFINFDGNQIYLPRLVNSSTRQIVNSSTESVTSVQRALMTGNETGNSVPSPSPLLVEMPSTNKPPIED